MAYDYILFVDEAGDDAVERLKPDDPAGNSEWLCLGGYLVRADVEPELEQRRDDLLLSIGGQAGGVLHYRQYTAENRIQVVKKLASKTYPARGFAVCSYKKTMIGHSNARAAAVSVNHKNALYNFVCRLLLERVTHHVVRAAKTHGIERPILRIVMARRRGHHFGSFKAYVERLVHQAIAGTTYLATRQIEASVLRRNEIEQAPMEAVPGLQLADIVISAFFQSIEQLSPYYGDMPAIWLRPFMAERKTPPDRPRRWDNEGVTLYPAAKAAQLLTVEQSAFFERFGYQMDWFKTARPRHESHSFTQAQRMWSGEHDY